MSASFRFGLLFLITSIPMAEAIQAQVPDLIAVQGLLTDLGGTPVDLTLSVTFELYKDGVSVWSEDQTGVVVTGGVFNAILGKDVALDTVAFDEPIELGIKIKDELQLAPRTPLVSSPYALAVRGFRAVGVLDGSSKTVNVTTGADNNSIAAGVLGGTIGGGGGVFNGLDYGNSVNKDYGTIGGGGKNIVDANEATVSGGSQNSATGSGATVSGGHSNEASGSSATVPGGSLNEATRGYSFAAGRRAKALHGGTFVWADSLDATGADFASTAHNQFLVRASGGVGIGTDSPDAPLDIAGGDNWNLSTSDGDLKIGNDTYRMEFGVALNGGGAGISRINAVGGVGSLVLGGNETDVLIVNPSGGAYPFVTNTYSLGTSEKKWTAVWATNGTIQTSDARLKTAVDEVPYGLASVLKLRPVVYRWKDLDGRRKIGLIAQEVEDVIPEVVSTPTNDSEYYGLNYAELVPILIRAVQEQQERIEALEAQLVP